MTGIIIIEPSLFYGNGTDTFKKHLPEERPRSCSPRAQSGSGSRAARASSPNPPSWQFPSVSSIPRIIVAQGPLRQRGCVRCSRRKRLEDDPAGRTENIGGHRRSLSVGSARNTAPTHRFHPPLVPIRGMDTC